MKNSSIIRVGVVGMGFGRQVIVPAFRADPRSEVAVVCSSSQETATTAATQLDVPRSTQDWREVVADTSIDVVATALPPTLQPQVAAAALEAGKHVFCEKPLAMTASDASSLVRAAHESGLAHAVDFELPELASWQRARALLSEKVLGKLRHVFVRWHVETRAYRLREMDSWKVKAQAGGGSLLNFGSHVLHYLEWLFGEVRSASARFTPDVDADARFEAWLALADGTPVTVSVAADVPFGAGHSIDVYGESGRLTLENDTPAPTANFVLTLTTRDHGTKVVIDERGPDMGESRIAPVASLVTRFLDAVVGGPATHPGFDAGARVAHLTDVLRRSAANVRGLDA